MKKFMMAVVIAALAFVAWSSTGASGETYDLLAVATNGGDSSITCVEYKTDEDGIIVIGKTKNDGFGHSLTADAGYTNVPEPTSAMLLLLGFAGLARKRKVA